MADVCENETNILKTNVYFVLSNLFALEYSVLWLYLGNCDGIPANKFKLAKKKI